MLLNSTCSFVPLSCFFDGIVKIGWETQLNFVSFGDGAMTCSMAFIASALLLFLFSDVYGLVSECGTDRLESGEHRWRDPTMGSGP